MYEIVITDLKDENQKKNGENTSMSAIDRCKAIEQFKKMMDNKLIND